MSGTREKDPAPAPPGAGKKPDSQPSRVRTLAEWVSLGISALLILALAGYLLRESGRGDTPYVRTEVRPLLDQVRQEGSTFILPVEITNGGRRMLRALKVEVTYQGPDGKEESRELDIDYLGERSSQTVYLYFDRHPRDLKVEAKPLHYQVE